MAENDVHRVETGRRFAHTEGQVGDSLRTGEKDSRSKKKNYDIRYPEIWGRLSSCRSIEGSVSCLGQRVKSKLFRNDLERPTSPF